MTAPKRPMLRYFGGKWHAAPWVIEHFPKHRCYVEPYGGAASVLMRKPRSRVEVLNDIDLSISKTYRVLRNPLLAQRLQFQLLLTPFSRVEFEEAFDTHPDDDMIEVARKAIARGAMAFGTGLDCRESRPSGFRDFTGAGRTIPAEDWATYPDAVASFSNRLAGVVIDSRDALDVMRRHDGVDTLHYVDPPYVPSTRQGRRGYEHELDDAGHVALLDCLRKLRGHVVLSGYACALYDDALVGWRRVDRKFIDQARGKRTESLWLSPSIVASKGQMSLL